MPVGYLTQYALSCSTGQGEVLRERVLRFIRWWKDVDKTLTGLQGHGSPSDESGDTLRIDATTFSEQPPSAGLYKIYGRRTYLVAFVSVPASNRN